MRLVFALALVLTTSAVALALYGAHDTAAREGEHVVYLELRAGAWRGACSGVLIDPSTVLTAAHCVRSYREHRVTSVRVGNPRAATSRVAVSDVHVHPRFDPAHPELGFDVAVLTLTRPALGHTIASIAHASDDPVEQGTHVRIFGFGLVPRGRTFARQPNRLHDASLEYLAPHACFTGPVAQMAETRMCAASPTSGVCPGDSGGPAVREIDGQSFVVGLVSLAIDAQACTHTAAVLTRVSAMRPFIEAHVPGVR